MRTLARSCVALITVCAMALVGGCAAPGPSYTVQEQPAVQSGGPPAASGGGFLTVGPQDRTYVLRLDDRTPFGLGNLPQSLDLLYQKGYDQVGRQREADFQLGLTFVATARDNPEARAGNVVGGALLGAATGAIIGGALGSPGRGAAIGAGSGAALGLVSPAESAMVRIDVRIQSFRDGTISSKSAVVDLTNVPPEEAQNVIDMQLSRMLDALPAK
ncbi:MAG: YMGG-like glycine zipper-containing protein [Syntrophobacteraceae bacterium]